MAVRLIKMVKLANSTADRLIYGEALVVRIREVAVVGNCGFTAPRYISGHISSTVSHSNHTVRRQIS